MTGGDVNERNLESYERIARRYAGDSPAEDDPELRAACRAAFMERLPGPDVLEVGCGPGTDARALADAGLRVTATDACREFLAIVRERHPDLTVRWLDMTKPDLPPASFDGIYAFASFVHLPRASALPTLRALCRLLRRPGCLFLSLVRSDRVREYTIPDWGGRPDNPVLFTCHAPDEIDRLLRDAGFDDVEHLALRSALYDQMPRLVERGVELYQVIARREADGGRGGVEA